MPRSSCSRTELHSISSILNQRHGIRASLHWTTCQNSHQREIERQEHVPEHFVTSVKLLLCIMKFTVSASETLTSLCMAKKKINSKLCLPSSRTESGWSQLWSLLWRPAGLNTLNLRSGVLPQAWASHHYPQPNTEQLLSHQWQWRRQREVSHDHWYASTV